VRPGHAPLDRHGRGRLPERIASIRLYPCGRSRRPDGRRAATRPPCGRRPYSHHPQNIAASTPGTGSLPEKDP
jgi:hypothetical protein